MEELEVRNLLGRNVLLASLLAFIIGAGFQISQLDKFDVLSFFGALFIAVVCTKYYIYSVVLTYLPYAEKSKKTRIVKAVSLLQFVCIIGSHFVLAYTGVTEWEMGPVLILLIVGLVYTLFVSKYYLGEAKFPYLVIDAVIVFLFGFAYLLRKGIIKDPNFDVGSILMVLSLFVIATIIGFGLSAKSVISTT